MSVIKIMRKSMWIVDMTLDETVQETGNLPSACLSSPIPRSMFACSVACLFDETILLAVTAPITVEGAGNRTADTLKLVEHNNVGYSAAQKFTRHSTQ